MRFAPIAALSALAQCLPLCFALCLAGPAHASPHLVRTLPNKMTVLVRESRIRPLVSVQVWVNAGSRDESRSERGAASVLSYLPYEATAKRGRGEIAKEVRSIGGTIGSESGYGQTVYNMTVPARHLAQALDILSDAVIRPVFDTFTFSQAAGRARRDSRGTLSSASAASLNPIRAALYEGTPLAAPIATPELEVAAITMSLVERFYKSHWVAENVSVVVVGDVDAEDAARKVADAFRDMPRGKAPAKPGVSVRPFSGPRIQEVPNPADTQGSAVTVGFRAPEWGTADAIALDVLMALLVDSPTSRLERRLHEGDEFTSAVAHRSFEAGGGVVSLSLAGDPGRMPDAEGVLVQEIERARSTPVTQEECDAAIRAIRAREIVPQSELWGLARVAAIAWLQGRPGADEVYWKRLEAVRPEDLVAVARRYLDWKQAAAVEMVPGRTADSLGLKGGLERRIREKQSLYGGTYRSGPQATGSEDAARRARIDAPLAAIPTAPFDPGRGRVERTALRGGFRLLTSEDHSAPTVTIAVYLNGGVRYESDKNNGITSLVRESMLNSDDPSGGGTYRQTLSAQGRLVPYQDRDMWGISLAVPANEWRGALDRLGAMFARAELDSITVDATRIFLLDALDKWLEDDEAQRQRLIFATKYTVSGYRLPGIGSRVNLVSMPTAVVKEFHRKFVVRPNLVVSVFGDVRAADVAPAVDRAFGGVGPGPFAPGPLPKEMPFEGFRERWELGAGPVTTVQLAFNGPPAGSPDVPVMNVVSSLLSGPYGWFEKFLRSDPVVNGAESIVSQAVEESPIVATLWLNGPAREEDLVKLLFRQFRKVAGMELTGDELSNDFVRAKTHAVGSYLAAFSTNTARAFQWARAEIFGLPQDYAITLPSRMDAVTTGDLLRIGRKYFQANDFERHPYAIAETRPGGW
jgi:zinc protease